MGFLKRHAEQPAAPVDPVQRAIEQLRKAHADPAQPHETRHFMYVPGVTNAQQVADALKAPGRHIEIDTSARQGFWLVVVIVHIVITTEAMDALRAEFEAAAEAVGGEYDYWQVAVANG
jgi:hypothetical protein